jgi:DNA-binding GntR family transcriptional regulator
MISGAALGPLAVVDIYLAARCAAAADEPDLETTPVYQLAERVSGQRVSEIRQDVTAHPLTATQARQLQGRAGAPGLQVTGQFLPETGFPLEVSRSVHPADRFTFSLRLRQS